MASGPEVNGESRKEEKQENNLMTLLFSAALPGLLSSGGKH